MVYWLGNYLMVSNDSLHIFCKILMGSLACYSTPALTFAFGDSIV